MGSSQSTAAEPVAPAPKPDAKVEIPDVAPVQATEDVIAPSPPSSHIADIQSLNTQSLISLESCKKLKQEAI